MRERRVGAGKTRAERGKIKTLFCRLCSLSASKTDADRPLEARLEMEALANYGSSSDDEDKIPAAARTEGEDGACFGGGQKMGSD